MSKIWSAIEEMGDRLGAVAYFWHEGLGDEFSACRAAFLRRLPAPATSYPCPRECGCMHRVVRHADGSIVGVCRCDPWNCDNIPLTEEDLQVYALDLHLLGLAVARAFGFSIREADLGLSNTLQIAAYGDQALPIILTIPAGPNDFRRVAVELVARLRGKFILVAPTANGLDAANQELLTGGGVGFLALDTTVRLDAGGQLRTIRSAQEILAPLVPDQEPADEHVVGTALALISKLDSVPGDRRPTHAEFFHLYCAKELSLEQIAKTTGCSLGTSSHRKRRCEEMLKTPLEAFRRHGALIDHLDRQRREAHARHIPGRALIEDDAGFDER